MDTNIVPTKEVQGRTNIYLNNVTYEDALDIVLLTNGLAAVRNDNIITVMPLERYTTLYGKKYEDIRRIHTYKLKYASPKDIMGAISQLKSDIGKIIIDESTGTVILMDTAEALDLMEKTMRALDVSTDTEIFELKYAKVEDLKGQLGAVLTPGSSQVEVDTRTNKIAITDLPEKMKKIKKMIAAFDAETRQVLIEAQIVQVALNDKTQYGIDWERIFDAIKVEPIDIVGKFPISGLTDVMTVGTLEQNDFAIVIQALQNIANTKILSRPRIAVVHNQEASILIGTKEVYFSQTQSQSSVTTTTAETVNYVDVGVKLNVTPIINEDGYVTMKIRPEVSSVREFATSPLGSRVPVVETSQAETTVKVRDKAMVMIAGLMKDEDRLTRDQLPFFGNIPGLRWLFGNRVTEKKKQELAIFLTPTIISGDVVSSDAKDEYVARQCGIVTKQFKDRME
jgi:type II secretory pathway component GspD/PulD (secretin)